MNMRVVGVARLNTKRNGLHAVRMAHTYTGGMESLLLLEC